jgi:peptide/nickel transport system ATP-binding protein
VLTLDHVTKTYRVGTFGGGVMTAVRDVSFSIEPGEIVALIGESGSGKTTIGKMILGLVSVSVGSISLDGTDITTPGQGGRRAYYRRVQGVFQDPFSSYNPIFKVDHVFDLVRGVYFGGISEKAWDEKLAAALRTVGLEAGQVLGAYPHQLSGGQLQRLLVARALLLDIEILVADEIISMLDASTRIDVLNLLGDLKARGLGVLFITHDLSLGNYISDRALILRRGRIVELGPTPDVFGQPLHPYTRRLLASVAHLHTRWRDEPRSAAVDGEPCVYHSRLAAGAPVAPGGDLVEVAPGHLVACAYLAEEGACPQAEPVAVAS